MEMFVPQMTRVDSPPNASASEVPGFKFEKVASDRGSPPLATGMPSSPIKMRLRRAGVEAKASEWISPRRDDMRGTPDESIVRSERTNKPLLLLGTSDRISLPLRGGLELEV
jgi:hypothetical protein